MGLKVTNNAFGTLNAGITSSSTTIVLQAGEGARFPTLSAGDYFYATLIDTSNNLEIVKVTARSTDTMTVVRAQDNTTARAFSTNDRFELRPTAALFNEVIQAVENVVPATVSDKANTSTGYFAVPKGTTAQRPGSPVAGMIRHNTDTDEPEWYDDQNSTWRSFAEKSYNGYTIDYLIVAGGGAPAGSWSSGGGGGGGLIESQMLVNSSTNYKVIIGAGATWSQSNQDAATTGSDSSLQGIVAPGGGGGGGYARVGTRGGSGGGGGSTAGESSAGVPGYSVYGKGFRGGFGNTTGNPNYSAGGGGGAGGVGSDAPSQSTSGRGGPGHRSDITGTLSYYAAGGAGGSNSGEQTGGEGSTARGVSGGANTGTGGGGNNGATDTNKGNGGSGIVVIRYPGSQRGSGGTVTSVTIKGVSYTVHTFTSSGTYTA